MSQAINNDLSEIKSYEEDASLYRHFLLMPEKYKGQTAHLRVVMKGKFSGWRLRASLLKAFGFEEGNVLFMNNVVAMGIDTSDIEDSVLDVDCFAEGEAANWVLDEKVTTGTVFEGEFEFRYELVKGVAGVKGSIRSEDAKIAMLVLKKGIKVIEHGTIKKDTENVDEMADYFRNILGNRLLATKI